jgi:hypothetical protein
MFDISRPQRGDQPDRAGYETGLMCDVNLPRTDGKTGDITWQSDLFDHFAARKLIKTMRKQPLNLAVYFNDRDLMDKDLCGY